MLTLCSARAWQSLPRVPGRSSKRIVNSLLVGMVGTSLRCTSKDGLERSCEIQRCLESYACEAGTSRHRTEIGGQKLLASSASMGRRVHRGMCGLPEWGARRSGRHMVPSRGAIPRVLHRDHGLLPRPGARLGCRQDVRNASRTRYLIFV